MDKKSKKVMKSVKPLMEKASELKIKSMSIKNGKADVTLHDGSKPTIEQLREMGLDISRNGNGVRVIL